VSTSRELDRRRRRRNRNIYVVVLVIVAFGIGVALGQALHDNPQPGGTQTTILTFKP
jgi:hypothetical protein